MHSNRDLKCTDVSAGPPDKINEDDIESTLNLFLFMHKFHFNFMFKNEHFDSISNSFPTF